MYLLVGWGGWRDVDLCGPHIVDQCENGNYHGMWIDMQRKGIHTEGSTLKGSIPRVMLDDGRETFFITVGTPAAQHKVKRSVVDRCLSKGDVYG